MGALHDGHLSLIAASKKDCDITVCSIFVNPTQFNEKSDLAKYPRPVKKDKALLESVQNDIVYIPGVNEIYPQGTLKMLEVDLEGLDGKLEGAFRPGHFVGVVQVVKRLLDIVQADKLFMGQKDFQQFTIIQKMLDQLKINTKLVVVPIKREEDGLAMSSRNVRLSTEFRKKALVLNKSLQLAKKELPLSDLISIKVKALKNIEKEGLKLEYFELINGHTLDKIKSINECDYIVAVVAAWAGDVRLIDNEVLVKA